MICAVAVRLVTLASLGVAALGCAPPQQSTGDGGPEVDRVVPRASCDAPIGGPPQWSLTTTEGEAGFDEALAALDLAALPAQIDISFESDFLRSIVAYALEVDIDSLGSLDRDALLDSEMGRAVLGAAATADRAGLDGVDIPFLRRGLHRYYACSRGLPLSLDDFLATVFDHRDVEPDRVELSQPKGGTRLLYGMPGGGVFVAETVDDDGAVRETEILVDGERADGSLDFLVYDINGDLADRSEFATQGDSNVIGASPYTCMTCHRNPTTWRYDVLIPDLP
jgi:hypothetical protein